MAVYLRVPACPKPEIILLLAYSHCLNHVEQLTNPWIKANMGIKGIRTALKVDLDKPAWEQPGLHVCSCVLEVVRYC